MENIKSKSQGIWIRGRISDLSANNFIRKLAIIESSTPKEDVKIFITSEGGSVAAALKMYKAIKRCSLPTQTIVIEKACGTAVIVALAGRTKLAVNNAKIILREPLIYSKKGGTFEQCKAAFSNVKKLRKKQIHILCKHTGRTKKEIKQVLSTKQAFTMEEAMKFGFVDRVVKLQETMCV